MARSEKQPNGRKGDGAAHNRTTTTTTTRRRSLQELLETILMLLLAQSLAVPWDTYGRPRPLGATPCLGDGLDALALRDHVYAMFDKELSSPRDQTLERLIAEFNERILQVRPLLTVEPQPATTTATPDFGNNVAATTNNNNQQDMTIEDIDLVDFMWRRDIDVEKGVHPLVETPDRQHEQDMQLLNEKHLARDAQADPQTLLAGLMDEYQDLVEASANYEKNSLFNQGRLEKKMAKTVPPGLSRENEDRAKMLVPEPERGEVDEDGYMELDYSPEKCDELMLLEDDDVSRNNDCAAKAEPTLNRLNQQGDEQIDTPLLDRDLMDEFFVEGADHVFDQQNEPTSTNIIGPAPGFGPCPDLDLNLTPTIEMDDAEVTELFNDQQFRQDLVTHAADQQLIEQTGNSQQPNTNVPQPINRPSSTGAASTSAASGSRTISICSGDSGYVGDNNNNGGVAVKMESDQEQNYDECSVASPVYTDDHHISRLYGKLLPKQEDQIDGDYDYVDVDANDDEQQFGYASAAPSSTSATASTSTNVRNPRRAGRHSEDQQLISQHDLRPYTAEQLADLSQAQFKRVLAQWTPAQQQAAKLLRKRVKNKAAARRCRDNKIDEKDRLERENAQLEREYQQQRRLGQELQVEIQQEHDQIAKLHQQQQYHR